MKVRDEVLGVLSRMDADGNVLRICDGQLDRKLYLSLNEVLEAMGGKWNRKVKGHIFNEDPHLYLENVLLTGQIIKPQNFGYFPTPPAVVKRLIELADVEPGMRVLEPSAGQGAIAQAAAEIVGKDNVLCIELLERNFGKLRELGFDGYCGDFLSREPDELSISRFDRVVMNPPFERQQDIDHVLHAFNFLKPGGLLVSVMSAGVEFRENQKTIAFRKFLHEFGGYCQPVEEGAFKESGTLVRTVIVRVDKP